MHAAQEFRDLEESMWRAETRGSSIWVRDGGAWRLRFHQGTPVRPA
ncbi:MAG TPA: hypothetical protein VMI73_04110 [Trebonia sp.]|nr:hypothetical protein [Trebonia sp.]